jgi:hypothetical protein
LGQLRIKKYPINEDKKMNSIEVSPVNQFSFVTTSTPKKPSKKLSASWIKVDGKLVCHWLSE